MTSTDVPDHKIEETKPDVMRQGTRDETAESVQTLLEEYGRRIGLDIANYTVYGSARRPISHVWAQIPFAVYMQSKRAATGYHTYVATPGEITDEAVASYQLTLIRPGQPQAVRGVTDDTPAFDDLTWYEVCHVLGTEYYGVVQVGEHFDLIDITNEEKIIVSKASQAHIEKWFWEHWGKAEAIEEAMKQALEDNNPERYAKLETLLKKPS